MGAGASRKNSNGGLECMRVHNVRVCIATTRSAQPGPRGASRATVSSRRTRELPHAAEFRSKLWQMFRKRIRRRFCQPIGFTLQQRRLIARTIARGGFAQSRRRRHRGQRGTPNEELLVFHVARKSAKRAMFRAVVSVFRIVKHLNWGCIGRTTSRATNEVIMNIPWCKIQVSIPRHVFKPGHSLCFGLYN